MVSADQEQCNSQRRSCSSATGGAFHPQVLGPNGSVPAVPQLLGAFAHGHLEGLGKAVVEPGGVHFPYAVRSSQSFRKEITKTVDTRQCFILTRGALRGGLAVALATP